jgi:hypothetical protein
MEIEDGNGEYQERKVESRKPGANLTQTSSHECSEIRRLDGFHDPKQRA